MGKVTKAIEHFTAEEILEKIKETTGFWRVRRWMIIYEALVNPKTAEEIALNAGVSKYTVNHLISAYNRYGEKAVETNGKAQRQNAYLTLEDEKKFLNQFIKEAKDGQITTDRDIKLCFEKIVGNEVAESTISRLLERHGWRKITPRPTHPKTDKEAQEAFKKTSKMKQKKS